MLHTHTPLPSYGITPDTSPAHRIFSTDIAERLDRLQDTNALLAQEMAARPFLKEREGAPPPAKSLVLKPKN